MAEPDITGALLARLKADSGVTALTGAIRIATALGDVALEAEWAMPDYAIVCQPVGGPPEDLELDLVWQRYDIVCYGPGKTGPIRQMNAKRLADLVYACLVPTRASLRSSSFTLAHTLVHKTLAESQARLIEFPDDWTKILRTYDLLYSRVYIP